MPIAHSHLKFCSNDVQSKKLTIDGAVFDFFDFCLSFCLPKAKGRKFELSKFINFKNVKISQIKHIYRYKLLYIILYKNILVWVGSGGVCGCVRVCDTSLEPSRPPHERTSAARTPARAARPQ